MHGLKKNKIFTLLLGIPEERPASRWRCGQLHEAKHSTLHSAPYDAQEGACMHAWPVEVKACTGVRHQLHAKCSLGRSRTSCFGLASRRSLYSCSICAAATLSGFAAL